MNEPGGVYSDWHPFLTYHHHPHLYRDMGMVMMGFRRYPHSTNGGKGATSSYAPVVVLLHGVKTDDPSYCAERRDNEQDVGHGAFLYSKE